MRIANLITSYLPQVFMLDSLQSRERAKKSKQGENQGWAEGRADELGPIGMEQRDSSEPQSVEANVCHCERLSSRFGRPVKLSNMLLLSRSSPPQCHVGWSVQETCTVPWRLASSIEQRSSRRTDEHNVAVE